MLKTKQNQKNIFLFIKLILFAGLLFVIYLQLDEIGKSDWEVLRFSQPLAFVLALLFVFPNIWLAYMKWRLTLNLIDKHTDKRTKIQSFFAGLVTGMLTPNMIGNFIGRFYYFERSKRIPITLFTLLSNYAQFLASLAFGWLAVMLAGGLLVYKEATSFVLWLGIGLIIAFLFYYFVDTFLNTIRKKGYTEDFSKSLKANRFFRSQLLGLSLLRFVVFTMQFSLMLYAFGQEINWQTILAIWQVYLITMIVPSIVLGKVGVRESIAMFVLMGLGLNGFAILFSSLIIWFINSLAPALFGLIICKRPLSNV